MKLNYLGICILNLMISIKLTFTSNLYQISVINTVLVEINEAKQFKHIRSSGYSNLLLYDDKLYLSGNDYVFCLNALNISCAQRTECGYNEKFISATGTNNREEINYVRFLTFREKFDDLIVCGTNRGGLLLFSGNNILNSYVNLNFNNIKNNCRDYI